MAQGVGLREPVGPEHLHDTPRESPGGVAAVESSPCAPGEGLGILVRLTLSRRDGPAAATEWPGPGWDSLGCAWGVLTLST